VAPNLASEYILPAAGFGSLAVNNSTALNSSATQRGLMADDNEERRLQDLRDFEFYSQRVRPTASDLLRTNELAFKNNKISLRSDKTDERGRGVEGLRTPASLADIYRDSRWGAERSGGEAFQSSAKTAKTEAIWLLVAAAIILGIAGRGGSIDRTIEALAF